MSMMAALGLTNNNQETQTNPVIQENVDHLKNLLKENNIEYTIEPKFDGFVISFSDGKDVACHSMSAGGDEGLFESYGFASDYGDVTGNLTAEEVIEKIQEEERK